MPNPRKTILVVEDEAPIAATIVYALETEGFATVWTSTGREALSALKQPPAIALVVLDIGLPDINGYDVCRAILRDHELPIIFLTARSEEVDKIVGLELGADDYIAKPFSPREFTARVRAVLRRASGEKNHEADRGGAGPWHHDAARCRIGYGGHTLNLTRNEYRLLGVLLAQPGRVFSREQLMAAAWDDPASALDRTVDAHIKTLRAKLREIAAEKELIVTHRGLGYSLREE